ncbi:YncE family protein [Prevotella sp.]|uniref:YncE family protein n=1 Tax=Prevotella sp. TaxID=59823 RepID=UPI002F9528C6
MKKLFLNLSMLLAAVATFTSCSKEDNNGPQLRIYSNGAYVVNAGNMGSKIDGSLTAIDYKSNTAKQKVFLGANGVSLGNTANDGLVYGSKAYIVVDQENTIEVVDKTTFKRIKQIKTTELLGADEGKSPRHIVSGYGKVFVSTFGGVVAEIDTVNFKLVKKYTVGKYPEGMLLNGNSLLVANSNYGNGGGNISIVDLYSGKVTTKNVKDVENPQRFFVGADHNLYVLDWAIYDPKTWAPKTENALRLVSPDLTTSKKVANANYVAALNGVFYMINAPYGAPATYSVYTPGAGAVASWKLSETVQYPCGLSIDPVTGEFFVLSNSKSKDGEFADYNADGYLYRYNTAGTKVADYKVGVGPVVVFFNAGAEWLNN